jgi:hypothetical protein
MVTATNLIYSVSAVRRIFNIAAGVAVRMERWAFVVWINISGQRTRFVSFADFKRHFVDRRKSEAQSLSVSRVANFGNIFNVQNPDKNSFYQVYVTADKVVCGCDDYRNQDTFLDGKRRCCKHGYAVLRVLGFNSLHEYLGN